ncbi:MAG: twin-arginine translocase TatA/TatE family subunit [Planctomycetota bacterium]
MHTLGFIQNIGWQELTIILVIALLIFGRRLPEVGRSLGKAIVEFKKGVKSVQDEIDTAEREPAKPTSPPPLSEPRVEHTAAPQPAADAAPSEPKRDA